MPAAEYLSGNVRVKLEQARAAAARDTSLEVNVAALERVLPPDLGAEEIAPGSARRGSTPTTHRQFLAELLDDPDVEVEHPGATIWAVKGRAWTRSRRPASGAPAGWTRWQIAKAVMRAAADHA